jgi:hypothetical protein
MVHLAGAGLGLACAGHLLAQAGYRTRHPAPPPRKAGPSLLLSDAAQALMADVLGRHDIFADLPRIARRVVLWGSDQPVTLPHGAVVVSQADLEARIPMMDGPTTDMAALEPAGFTIHAAHVPATAGQIVRFGHRLARACPVTLAIDADRSAAFVEAVAQGWLFLIPSGQDSGWLLGVGGDVDDLLGQSRLIERQLAGVGNSGAPMETAPRILPRLAGKDWLALGSAALGFDPICGDGSAQSLREAVLASAVVDRVLGGRDEAALAHYQAMLVAAMRRHVQMSARFYASGGTGPWWHEQVADTVRGHEWCTAYLAACPEPAFTLQGLTLHPRELAA